MIGNRQQSRESRIALGICGGIAAYKAAELARLLIKAGYDVIPMMTPWGARFVGPLTLQALTGHRVRLDIEGLSDAESVEHVALVRSCSLLLIAPLTANTLAKMVHGIADNFLTTACLAHRGEILVCPAMNTAMLTHPATQRNLEQIARDGAHVCMGEAGDLACGEEGEGRMAEPEAIADHVAAVMAPVIPSLRHARVLVSAGPTRESLDPVRFFSNRSTGKMGFAVARAFRDAGAHVTLVHGPVDLRCPALVESIPVQSAREMAEAILPLQGGMDVIVMAAAVADYRPTANPQKLKKDVFDGVVKMERTTDILEQLGQKKRPGQILAGFAAESENLDVYAHDKLVKKNLDLLFANDISKPDIGFGSDFNEMIVYDVAAEPKILEKSSKTDLARNIVQRVAQKRNLLLG